MIDFCVLVLNSKQVKQPLLTLLPSLSTLEGWAQQRGELAPGHPSNSENSSKLFHFSNHFLFLSVIHTAQHTHPLIVAVI